MCGIAGIAVRPDKYLSNIQERLSAMSHVMRHRGPDDEGIYVSADGRVGIANRRLAVRDLSPAGHMPMANQDGTIWITYNGEIYNTPELKPELERSGYTFTSNSDTEVILKGYEAGGSDFIRRLEGMFALAIYDYRPFDKAQVSQRLVLARDQMGIKPLYYAFTPEGLVFASELKGLLASGLVGREINPCGLVGYFLTGSVPNPYTIYRDICALPPAHLLEFNLSNWGQCQSTPYWELPVDVSEVKTEGEAVECINNLLVEAVRIRLVSDVPLGAFLSGGLDSSSVVALMRQTTDGPIRTCSMVFDEAEYTEASYARAMADAVGSEHYERVITAADVAREFHNILYAMDQPSVDGVNTYFVSQTAREAGLTVALSGLGGDELFGGYANTFGDVPRIFKALTLTQAVPGGCWLAHQVIDRLPRRQRWARIQDALDRPATLASAYLTRRGLFSPSEAKRLVHKDIWQAAASNFDIVAHVSARSHESGNSPTDLFSWISRAELRAYTHDQLLRDTDVMSMIHSLEVRVPLLDTRLVEAMLRLPSRTKISKDKRPKPLLTRVMDHRLPDKIASRKDKQGFSFPFDLWLRGELRQRAMEVLQTVKLYDGLETTAVDRIFEDFDNGNIHWSRAWSLVALGSILCVD